MLDLVVAVRDEAVFAANLGRSPLLRRGEAMLHAQRGYPNAGLAFDDALRHCRGELVVVAQQDVYLPAGWERYLRAALARLAVTDPRWGVLGVAGVTGSGIPVGCLWNSRIGMLRGEPFDEPERVGSLDDVLLVLRRGAGLAFDTALPGFRFHATDLVQAALAAGLGAYAICAPVVHNPPPQGYLDADDFLAYRRLARKWRDRLPIGTPSARIVPMGSGYLAVRTRHKLGELRSRLLRRDRDREGACAGAGEDCVAVARRLRLE